ncbi:MAG: 2OG-Fe(II) oxygenase [Bacteroidia bacterium]
MAQKFCFSLPSPYFCFYSHYRIKMTTITEDILEFIKNITSNGTYSAFGKKDFILPRLSIKGFGELALPITELQARELIKAAHKAPFGKGSQTILDENVRSAWEIDANDLTFKSAKWEKWLEELVKEAKIQLGVGNQEVSASLYKMLIYEKGSFFTWHKDSEKEKNMFATLSITLPSEHTGGELAVRFKGEERVIDSAELTKEGDFAYAAFYADCDHEVRPLLSGYRICLVYNLLQSNLVASLSAETLAWQDDELSLMLGSWSKELDDKIQGFLLDHQYTPENFSMENLKLRDKARAEALISAAKKVGLYVRLGLLTHYQMGALEIDYSSKKRGYRYDDEYEDISDGTMGEVFDDDISVKNWADDGFPNFGEISLDEISLINPKEAEEDEPIEQAAEGYTGNAGMTIEYWYHHGCVFIWTEETHEELMTNLTLNRRLEWIAYYVDNYATNPKSPHFLQKLLTSIEIETNSYPYYRTEKSDASSLATAWILLDNAPEFQQYAQQLAPLFDRITLENWAALIEKYPIATFSPLFEQVFALRNPDFTLHLTNLLFLLKDKKIALPFVQQQIEILPIRLRQVATYVFSSTNGNKAEVAISLFSNLLKMSKFDFIPKSWHSQMVEVMATEKTREYVNGLLVNTLLQNQEAKHTPLFQQIYQICEQDLVARTTKEPQPLPNWTREVPVSNSAFQQKIWNMLSSFLLSPTEQIFNYTKAQTERTEMESAIKSVVIDLEMTTLTKGRPYTLQLKKNNATYNRLHKLWEIDCKLLAKLKAMED